MENYLGKVASMEDILEYRDKKIEIIEDFFNGTDSYNKKNGVLAVITISSINPGPIKNNRIYKDITEYGRNLALELIDSKYIKEIYLNETGGVSYLYTCRFLNMEEVHNLKRKFVEIEDKNEVGRLLDLDIILKDDSISRLKLGLPQRKCLICEKSAHLCNRSREHNMEDIINVINQIYVNIFKHYNEK